MRQLEPADPLHDGSREGPPLVAEELALEEPGGNGSAVELDETTVTPRAECVDQTGDASLPRSGLAAEEHDGVRRGDTLREAHHLPQRHALTQDAVRGGRAPQGVAPGAAPFGGPAAGGDPRQVARGCGPVCVERSKRRRRFVHGDPPMTHGFE